MQRREANMPSVPQSKVGIVACSGEEFAEGTVARLASLKVLNELRRSETVTICLPLFLAGGEDDRTFARFHPTITVDGCDLRCAARGTEMYSGKPAVSLVVNELLAERGLPRAGCRRRLDEAGRKAVEVTADRLVELVDDVLGRTGSCPEAATTTGPEDAGEVGCSCGSGIPALKLQIEGTLVEVVALPAIFRQLRDSRAEAAQDFGGKLLETVKIYNHVLPESERAWREVLLREYAAWCEREKSR
jgi:hypothetical protein